MEKFIHGFWHLENTDYLKLEKILNYFGDFKAAWESAKISDFKAARLDDVYYQQLEQAREKVDLNAALDKMWRADIVPIGRANAEFPESLKNIEKSPFLLYRRGTDLRNFSKMVAVVGMRKSTVQGEKIAFGLGRSLAQAGVVVVSGLAFGIDAAAHGGTLAAGKPTIGILASGIGKITPTSHNSLAKRMLEAGGSLISEYPINSNSFKQRYLERNRLIAGLAEAVVVVEAAKRSGALMTAGYALKQGKDIMAFPGDAGKVQSQGCNNLIKKGEAQLVDSIADVLENCGLASPINRRVYETADLDELKVIALVKSGVSEIDMLYEQTGLEFSQFQAIVGKLELAGIINRRGMHDWQLTD